MKKTFGEWLHLLNCRRTGRIKREFGLYLVPCKGKCGSKAYASDFGQLCSSCFISRYIMPAIKYIY